MKPATLFRLAALLALVQFLAHTSLLMTYQPAHGPEEVAVVQAMKDHLFSFSGFQRSYWDMYFGYGLFSAFNCLLEAMLLWFLAGVARTAPRQAAVAAGIFLLANLVYAGLVFRFFFALPGIFDLALAVLMILILVVSRRHPVESLAQA